jgi:hypothetical protein
MLAQEYRFLESSHFPNSSQNRHKVIEGNLMLCISSAVNARKKKGFRGCEKVSFAFKQRQPSKMLFSRNKALWVPQCSRGVRARTWV